MRRPRAVILAAALGGSLSSACHRSLASKDARTASNDADVSSDVRGESTTEGPAVDADSLDTAEDAAEDDGGPDAAACYPLFHACTSSEQCCAPNLCLTINGGPACQVEGPARTQFTNWTSCGWTSSETCLCDGIRACEAVAGGSFSALGSRQARVCALEGGVCEYVVFVETEGGGTARRCRTPINAGPCLGGIGDATDANCVDLFTCNLLMGTCPPDIMPGTSVISCR
jgi:hypothetical protein